MVWVILSKNLVKKTKKGIKLALIDTLLTTCPLMYPLNTLELFPNNPLPLSVSALFICVTREATWPELPRASGDWEQETRDKFPETARDQASKYVSD